MRRLTGTCAGCGQPNSAGCTLCGQCDLKRRRDAAAARIEDVEWLVGCGVSSVEIAARTGMTVEAAYRLLYRHGRPDLAHAFTKDVWAIRRARAPRTRRQRGTVDLAPCGTWAAYMRHHRRGEHIDDECREAARLRWVEQRARRRAA